jgi:hypothetical protein
MHVKLLIDEIVRQTTVLIAQLSTAAGIRAPLSHLADQVFVELAKELEAQGVRRTVVADMFGLALRSYQLKFQRLSETPRPHTSLWQDIHRELGGGARTKPELLSLLRTAEAADVTTVLNDLVGSGIAYVSGRGGTAVYGLTSESDRKRLSQVDEQQAIAHLVWQMVATGRADSRHGLMQQIDVEASTFEQALGTLLQDGRVRETDGVLSAESLDIPVGSELGWEAAVSDHFRAVATAIAAKLRLGRSERGDRIGGATFTFTVHSEHPSEQRVFALLERTRGEMEALWTEVSAFNHQNPPPEDAPRVTFYFGQNVTSVAAEAASESSP